MDHGELKSRIAWMIRDLGLLYADLLDEEYNNTTEGGGTMAGKKKSAAKPSKPAGKTKKK